MILWDAEFKKCCWFCICTMTLCHDVMSWRQKQAVFISACRRARKLIIFLFLQFFGLLSSKMLLFLCSHVITSWRDVMTAQNSLLCQLVDVLKLLYRFIFVDISVAEFQTIIVIVFAWYRLVIMWRHDVTEMTTWSQGTYITIIGKFSGFLLLPEDCFPQRFDSLKIAW